MKDIINDKEVTCKTTQPHGYLRDLLIEAQLNGWKVEIVRG